MPGCPGPTYLPNRWFCCLGDACKTTSARYSTTCTSSKLYCLITNGTWPRFVQLDINTSDSLHVLIALDINTSDSLHVLIALAQGVFPVNHGKQRIDCAKVRSTACIFLEFQSIWSMRPLETERELKVETRLQVRMLCNIPFLPCFCWVSQSLSFPVCVEAPVYVLIHSSLSNVFSHCI